MERDPQTEAEATPVETLPEEPQRTPPPICPYVGRRRHPSEAYTYATSHHVCYGRPRGSRRPYSHLRHRTQIEQCLEPMHGWSTCRYYLRAVAGGVPAPRTLSAEAGQAIGRRRRRRRHRRRPRAWMPSIQRVLILLLVLLGSILLGTLLSTAVRHLPGWF